MKKQLGIITLLIVINFYTFITIHSVLNDKSTIITILDVAQGDSILIKESNRFGLIDTGRGNLTLNQLNNYLPPLKREIDFIILTHPDLDHIEGILPLLDIYRVKTIYITKSLKGNDLTKSIYEKIKLKKIPVYYLNEDNDFKFNNLEFNIFHPKINTSIFTDANELSIGIEIILNKCSIYTAGDLGKNDEFDSINMLKDKKTEILKLGHHGSNTSTSESFIKELKPFVGIVSSGVNNSYKHPHFEVISTLLKNNVKILNTQIDKSIEIVIEEDNLSLKYNNFSTKYMCF